MIRQVTQSLRDWSGTTGLETKSFWLSLIFGFIFVTVGLATLLHAFRVQVNESLVWRDFTDPVPSSTMLLVYGVLFCVGCHGCFRRRRWGVGLVSFLALPGLFLVWSMPDVGFVSKALLTVGAYALTEDLRKLPENPAGPASTNGRRPNTV